MKNTRRDIPSTANASCFGFHIGWLLFSLICEGISFCALQFEETLCTKIYGSWWIRRRRWNLLTREIKTTYRSLRGVGRWSLWSMMLTLALAWHVTVDEILPIAVGYHFNMRYWHQAAPLVNSHAMTKLRLLQASRMNTETSTTDWKVWMQCHHGYVIGESTVVLVKIKTRPSDEGLAATAS